MRRAAFWKAAAATWYKSTQVSGSSQPRSVVQIYPAQSYNSTRADAVSAAYGRQIQRSTR
eukprot:3401642-Rhodomonas_salina.1